ncbi:MAG: MFS transporter [Dethiobacter sp.]|nr:MFS transporter [Dethiobacter sp.]
MNEKEWHSGVARVMRLRWFIWSLLGVAFFISIFHRVALTVVSEQIIGDFQLTGAVFGTLVAVYFYIYTFMQIPSGVLADSLGPKLTASLGIALAGIGSIIFGLAPTLGLVFVGRFLIGLGVSVVFIAIMKIQAEWFKTTEFATLSGLTAVIGGIGSLVATVPLAFLATTVGWGGSFVAVGIFSLVIAALCFIFVRNSPAAMGLPTIAKIQAAERGEHHSSSAGTYQAQKKVSTIKSLKIIFGNKYTWPMFITFFGFYGPFGAFKSMWSVPWLMHTYGFESTVASSYIFVGALGVIVGCPLIGYISDKVIRKRKLPFLVTGLCFLGLWMLVPLWNQGKPPVGVLYPLLFLIGFFYSAFILTFACVKEVNPAPLAGLATGTANAGGFLSIAILQPLLGYLLDLRWTGVMVNGARVYPVEAYRVVFLVSGLFVAVGILGLCLSKETNCTNVYHELVPSPAIEPQQL